MYSPMKASNSGDIQRWQQSIGLVRKAFLLTLTVSNSELWVTEVSELPNEEGPPAEYNMGLIYAFLAVPYQCSYELGLNHSSGRHRTHCWHTRDHPVPPPPPQTFACLDNLHSQDISLRR